MLPILNRPIVDYVVQDCIRAGIKDIYFVVGKDSEQVREYYSHNPDFEEHLRQNGKAEALASILPPADVSFHFVEQDQRGAYGTAVPVALCRDLIPDGESAVVCMGDDCLYYPDEQSSDVTRLIDQSGEGAGMIGVEINPQDTSSYGVIELDDSSHFVRIVEKPAPGKAPSNLINVSKYLFSSELLDETKRYVEQANPKGEYYITDPINTYVSQGHPLRVVSAKGEYLDAGTLAGWLKANEVVAAHEIK
jgi:UTP--glucose-1-phosphate uridylyltransferase